MKDLRIVARVYNNQLRERREATGKSARQFADEHGISYHAYIALEAMTVKPVTPDRGKFGRPQPIQWRPIALQLGQIFGVTPDILFPESVLTIEKREAEVRVNAEEMSVLMAPTEASTPFGLLVSAERDTEVAAALAKLSDRERRVLAMRFGIDGSGDGQGMSLTEIAEVEGVTFERIRQIEAKAMRKLRHPSVSGQLKPYIAA